MHFYRLDSCSPYLYLLNDGLELRRAVGPLFQHLHGFVEILHVLCVHLEEGCEFLQDVSDPRYGRPAERERGWWIPIWWIVSLLTVMWRPEFICNIENLNLTSILIHFGLKLTILPCVSPSPEAGTGCERCWWRRCWRRCSSPHPQGMFLYLPPPLA